MYHRYIQCAMEYWDYEFKPASEKLKDTILQEQMRYNLEQAIETNSNLLEVIEDRFDFKNKQQDRLILPTPAISEQRGSDFWSSAEPGREGGQQMHRLSGGQQQNQLLIMNSDFYPTIVKSTKNLNMGKEHVIINKHQKRDRKSTRLNSSHPSISRMPSSA